VAFKKNCGNIFILVIVLFATLANADDWAEIAMFADYYQDYFRNILNWKIEHRPTMQFEANLKERFLKTAEKAHGRLEIREYYQTEYIKWLKQKGARKGLKSIIMERKTIKKETKNEWNTVISLVA